MKVGVIGAGGLGRALALGLVKQGVDVQVCDRHPEKLAGFAATTADPRAVSGDVVVAPNS